MLKQFGSQVRHVFLMALFISLSAVSSAIGPVIPAPVELSSGWQLQFEDKTSQNGAEIAAANYQTVGWYRATVPGTVLTSLVNDKVYPEPLYGENNRPEIIPDSLARQS